MSIRVPAATTPGAVPVTTAAPAGHVQTRTVAVSAEKFDSHHQLVAAAPNRHSVIVYNRASDVCWIGSDPDRPGTWFPIISGMAIEIEPATAELLVALEPGGTPATLYVLSVLEGSE